MGTREVFFPLVSFCPQGKSGMTIGIRNEPSLACSSKLVCSILSFLGPLSGSACYAHAVGKFFSRTDSVVISPSTERRTDSPSRKKRLAERISATCFSVSSFFPFSFCAFILFFLPPPLPWPNFSPPFLLFPFPFS